MKTLPLAEDMHKTKHWLYVAFMCRGDRVSMLFLEESGSIKGIIFEILL
jgi:hypothetical protein